MRVLHLVKTAVGATWALRQMRELVRLGVEVHVAAPGGPLIAGYEAAEVSVHRLQTDLPVRKPSRIPGMLGEFRDLVASVEPDIIHSHFVGTTLTMRLALGRHHSIPRIFQVPGPLHLEQPFFRVAEISTASAADYWIGSCRWTCARYHQSGIAPARVFLSYYGTDLDKFDRSCKGKLRQELGVNDETKLIGMVAYMYPPRRYLGQRRGIKGHEDLIEAIAICLRKEPAIVGVFIGGAWNGAVAYEQRVRAFGRARCGNRAVFLGARDDAAQLYPDLDVAVHPSYSENVGGAVESLLQEVPTIATNVGGLPDIVIDGETGWLVPPRSPERLAEAILESLYNPGKSAEYAAKGRQLARQLFDVRITAQQVLDIYHAILSKRNVDAHRRN